MSDQKLSGAQWITLTLRWTMEAGVVLGLVDWGIYAGGSVGLKVVLAIAAPAVVFGFWGLVDFRRLGNAAEWARLTQELAITALVALALMAAGAPIFGWVLLAVSVMHHILVYATGDRLIKETPARVR